MARKTDATRSRDAATFRVQASASGGSGRCILNHRLRRSLTTSPCPCFRRRRAATGAYENVAAVFLAPSDVTTRCHAALFDTPPFDRDGWGTIIILNMY